MQNVQALNTSSGRFPAGNWDIAHVDRQQEGATGVSVWTETFAARVFGTALTTQPEFFTHVQAVRSGKDASVVAVPYVRRSQGHRRELLAVYLDRAAEPDPWSVHQARMYVWNILPIGWVVGAPRTNPSAPARAIRSDAAETIAHGALRVARRGARRCCAVYCDPLPGSRGKPGVSTANHPPKIGRGEVLAKNRVGDYCLACAQQVTRRQHSRGLEAERRMFDAAIPVVLGVESRPRARRRRRSAA